MAQPKKTLYEILGVTPDATSIDIGLAYQNRVAELQRAVPPDASGVALNQQAYEILSNAKRREAYDASLVTAAEKLAAQSQATDFEIEPEATADDDRKRKLKLLAMVGGVALIFMALFLVFRPPAPAPAPPVVEAPVPPPPPKAKSDAEILLEASLKSGQLLSYSMSGAALPLGMALEVEQNLMITTCHGLPAGSKFVVKVGQQMHAAELVMVDEQLDLCKFLVPAFGTPPLRIATEDAKLGEKIFALGMNAKGEMAATEGTVKQIRTTPLGKVFEISVPIAPTASGGGIFNDQGQLVAVATTPHKYGAGLNIALPASWIAQMRSRSATPAQ
ncbi:MAG: trypsin-like peptidase domain-containing protein [Usitatibacter sp.]